ncbi:polysaccharide deacetylase family protein [Candidatus Nitronereus thalassa]|uniref:Polysaccharide deacetylase family protein n=1 Tax=Candidatus Nitronereus thalassa TaxID=3020898 RepID=A0ABU3KAW3_9BACT|nr:polysaccharide deacetylase family protein [Candidatus Nitronereus thalassa]MDT7043630.1 polysaccharide deacetylase family protein [Candidatus Nitronereus thalassa]
MFNVEPSDYCNIAPYEKPRLTVVIDTEEEFDWSRDFARENTSVQAMQWVGRAQSVFDDYGITPVYVIDYPVASQPNGYEPLVEIHKDGRCIIGTHLHPWVNPPFEEVVNRKNSFAGNLPMTLEKTKLLVLTECIEAHFGRRPTIYKAGRYGVGPHTTTILEELGYEIDLSVCPHMDYSSEEGPDYSANTSWPFWFGKEKQLLELPLTVGFTGLLRHLGPVLHPLASNDFFTSLRVPGILGRLKLLNKSWLSPEGYPTIEHQQLTRTLYNAGLRVFSMAFHSPSVEPGHTPYVQTKADLEDFLGRLRRFFDFFFGEMQGVASTPLILKQELRKT